jgi:hypothetical protein
MHGSEGRRQVAIDPDHKGNPCSDSRSGKKKQQGTREAEHAPEPCEVSRRCSDLLYLWPGVVSAARARTATRKRGTQPVHTLGTAAAGHHTVSGAANFASSAPEDFSTSACMLLPRASIVTITGKSLTRRCHIASGMPNSRKSTPDTSTIHLA